MIFGKKKKQKKINKKELLRKKNRRTQIIMEAVRIHNKAQKKSREKKKNNEPMMGGVMNVKSMEEQDLAFAIGHGVSKAIQIGENALHRIRQRGKKLQKSKSSHLNRLKKARKTMTARSRA